VEQALAVRGAIAKAQPSLEASLNRAYEQLKADLEALDARLAAAVAQDPTRPVIFSHPVYQYLAARYNMVSQSLHWEPGEEPTEEQWKELVHRVDHDPLHWMIWERDPLPEVVARLTEMGIQSVVFEPCGNRPSSGDYMSIMASNAEGLETAYSSVP
jgi:zinc transport system substrate-binding protein